MKLTATVIDSSATAHMGPPSKVVNGITNAEAGWLGNGSNGYVTLDLGAPQDFDLIRVYRYNEGGYIGYTARTPSSIQLQIADNPGGPWTTVFSDWAQPFYPTNSPTNFIIPNDLKFHWTTARYVKLNLTGWNSGSIGLNEVELYQAIPEPCTMALLAGGAAAILRRKAR